MSFTQPSPRPPARRFLLEDIEVRSSRAEGMSCRVLLRQGSEILAGNASTADTGRTMIDVVAEATLLALATAGESRAPLVLESAQLLIAAGHRFVFVVVAAALPRETVLLSGSAEVRDGVELATVLATLDATNRWLERERSERARRTA
ncbi:MAG TPA: hypothetical protein VFK13_03160 [Gemmatimonadaceae bacterium]|nr:hypothetical protein [Gemmatimonadaceae bacterium]